MSSRSAMNAIKGIAFTVLEILATTDKSLKYRLVYASDEIIELLRRIDEADEEKFGISVDEIRKLLPTRRLAENIQYLSNLEAAVIAKKLTSLIWDISKS